MTSDSDMSLVRLIFDASWVVQLVLALLLLGSVYSWSIILRKAAALKAAHAAAERFETAFWSGSDLTTLYKAIGDRGGASGMENMFEMGFREFARLRQQNVASADGLLDGPRRAMRAAQLKETERLEAQLATLATIGSISPYVGLFGTVWGILHAFMGLGSVEQATLQMVAPGIAEALVATAIGLLAAIPAVVAYNRFADQVSRLEMRFDAFLEEFSALLQRHATRGQ
jgi:biopolymer transport protein TolQ